MLNGKFVKITTGGAFATIDEGVYTAEIIDVDLLEDVVTAFSPEGKNMLNFKFAILDDIEIPAKDGMPASNTRDRFLWHRMTPSLNEKATMSKLVKAALGRLPTPEEANAFNPESLIGKQVQVVVVNNPSKDGTRTFSNIDNYLKAPKPLPKFTGEVGSKEVLTRATSAIEAPKTDAEVSDSLKSLGI